MTKGLIGVSLVLMALVAAAALLTAPSTDASHGVGGNGIIDIIAVDLENTLNGPTVVDDVDACRDGLVVTDSFTVDIVVDELVAPDTIGGVTFNLMYDPTILSITARSGGAAVLFYQSAPLGVYTDAGSSALPDTDGDYLHDAVELGGTGESGEGVVAQITVTVVGAGVSALDLLDNLEGDGMPNVVQAVTGNVYFLNQVIDGEVHTDGSTCATATPSPTTPPTPSPPPTEIPTSTNPATPTPQIATPTPTPKPTCNTTLAANVAVGATTITVTSANGCAAGDTIRLGSGSSQEDVKISSVSGNTITLVAGVKKAHNAGETVVEVAAATAAPTTTPKTAPSTGDGSGDGGLSRTLLLLATLFGTVLVLTAGGSLLLARAKRQD